MTPSSGEPGPGATGDATWTSLRDQLPSTPMMCPVLQLACGAATRATTAATSSARPRRVYGVASPHEHPRQRGQRRHHVFGADHGALPGKHLRHQQLVDFRVPVGAPVFHHDEVIVEIGGEPHRCCRPRNMTDSSDAQTADYDAIQQEFRKRSLPSPLDLSPQADVTGSAFFPLLPQPKTLAMKDHTSKGEAELK
jgi:hypothetical protein